MSLSVTPCLLHTLPQAGAGKLAMEEDYMKKDHPDVVRQQHTSNVAASQSPDKKTSNSGPNGCLQCCRSTKNCLMSPECGRALSIASVIAMCGTCIRMWTCKFWDSRSFMIVPSSGPGGLLVYISLLQDSLITLVFCSFTDLFLSITWKITCPLHHWKASQWTDLEKWSKVME